MPLKSLYDFVTQDVSLQTQANFEFRYPILFKDDSFLINQIDWPNVELNQGNVYIDGYAIPVFSSPKYGTEIKFSMYVTEPFFEKYTEIFEAIINKADNVSEDGNNKLLYNQTLNTDWPSIPVGAKKGNPTLPCAEIIPLDPETSRNYTSNFATKATKSFFNTKNIYSSTLKLINAKIKSLSMNSGFSSNSIALAMFDVTMAFSYFEKCENAHIIDYNNKPSHSILDSYDYNSPVNSILDSNGSGQVYG